MEQPEVKEEVATVSASGNGAPAPAVSAARPAAGSLAPQACPSSGMAPAAYSGTAAAPSYVYAIGKIEPRFPRISVEKEFAQAVGRDKTAGLTDRQALHGVLSKPENRYLVRQLCWVMTIEGLETYILVPRDPADYSLLVEALRPAPQPWDLDCVIGFRGDHRRAGSVQRADGPNCGLRSDLLLRPRCARLKPSPSPRRLRPKSSLPRRRSYSTGSCRWRTTPGPPTSTAL